MLLCHYEYPFKPNSVTNLFLFLVIFYCCLIFFLKVHGGHYVYKFVSLKEIGVIRELRLETSMGDDITDPKNEKNTEVSPEEKEDEGEDGGMNLLNSDSVTPVRI